MPQLQINQGPQDALLYDNSKSYFTNVGYVRTSNFQMELRDIDSQNAAALGSTVQWVIPKAADLLGPVDLVCTFSAGSGGAAETHSSFVEAVGHAMIEKITLSVGSNDIETISGEQLHIINELMRGNDARLGKNQILKTSAPAVRLQKASGDETEPVSEVDNGRLINLGATAKGGQQLIVPLGLFFTKHPSQYFPLAAIAGCNDVRISIKFRPLKEIVQVGFTDYALDSSNQKVDGATAAGSHTAAADAFPSIGFESGKCKLRCHYVHVTGPEATTLMNKEHVRLMKLWGNPQSTPVTKSGNASAKIPIDLSFLHPVQELVIVIRKASELNGSTTTNYVLPNVQDQGAVAKNYFAFQGGGKDPNVDSLQNRCVLAKTGDASGSGVAGFDATCKSSTYTMESVKLTLNGQERHPGLEASKLDRNYLMNRLMPMLHSNTSTHFADLPSGAAYDNDHSFKQLAESLDRKEIYVYPFALAPENQNPSGAVNFSKVSHAKLEIELSATGLAGTTEDLQVDVWGVHYNWLQIKDGRALTSFA